MNGRGEERGQSLVEFALILPIFLVVLLGIFDGGRLVFAYNTVSNAAREAGREATVNQTAADIRNRASQHAVTLDIPAGAVLVDYRSTAAPDAVNSCPYAVGDVRITTCLAVVRVPYVFNGATPVISALVGPINLMGEVRFPVEFSCVDGGGIDCPLGQ